MGTLIGVVVGYALGTRAGEQGWTEFYEAWKVISSSDEVRDLVAGGFSVAKDLLAAAVSSSPARSTRLVKAPRCGLWRRDGDAIRRRIQGSLCSSRAGGQDHRSGR